MIDVSLGMVDRVVQGFRDGISSGYLVMTGTSAMFFFRLLQGLNPYDGLALGSPEVFFKGHVNRCAAGISNCLIECFLQANLCKCCAFA